MSSMSASPPVELPSKPRDTFKIVVSTVFVVLFGWSAMLVLLFVAILSQQLAAMPAAGKSVAKAMLTANLLGAGISVVFYEINVIAPSVVTAILLCAVLCVALGTLARSVRICRIRT